MLFGVSTILIVISALTSVFGFLGLVKKKEKLEEERKEVVQKQMEEIRNRRLSNAGKIGTAAAGIAGVAAGAYYINKQFSGKDKRTIKTPQLNIIRKSSKSIFRKKKKNYFNPFKK